MLYFSTTGSTNDEATKLAAGGNVEGAVVVADAQTAGRGRRGRHWFSPALGGLYVSVVLEPARSVADGDRATTLLTLAAGVALAEGVEAVTGLRADIKWPNDLLVQRRKLAGILAEGIHAPTPQVVQSPGERAASRSTVRAVILGYGLNVGSMAYPPDLADRVTSLESELGRPIDRAELCVETLAAIARRYDDLLEGRFDAILDAWRERAPGSRGRRVTWNGPSGVLSGVTAGIDEHGALLVSLGDRVERIVAGEVVWH